MKQIEIKGFNLFHLCVELQASMVFYLRGCRWVECKYCKREIHL